jgi:hypothetical protein
LDLVFNEVNTVLIVSVFFMDDDLRKLVMRRVFAGLPPHPPRAVRPRSVSPPSSLVPPSISMPFAQSHETLDDHEDETQHNTQQRIATGTKTEFRSLSSGLKDAVEWFDQHFTYPLVHTPIHTNTLTHASLSIPLLVNNVFSHWAEYFDRQFEVVVVGDVFMVYWKGDSSMDAAVFFLHGGGLSALSFAPCTVCASLHTLLIRIDQSDGGILNEQCVFLIINGTFESRLRNIWRTSTLLRWTFVDMVCIYTYIYIHTHMFNPSWSIMLHHAPF